MGGPLQLDAVDQLILNILEANSREPIQKIALKVGLSRGATYARVNRLQKIGVIVGFTIRRGLNQDTKNKVFAYLLLNVDGKMLDRVAKDLERIPQVKRCSVISGDLDIILEVQAQDMPHLYAIRNQVEVIRGVTKVTTGLVMSELFNRKT